MVFGKLFGGKSDGRPRKVVKLEKKITNMYIQPGDRQYFLDQLRQEGSIDAARVLLKRFTCSCENTTVDRDEKEMTYRLLVDMGPVGLEAVQEYLRNNDIGVNWPFRALRDLVSHEELLDFLIEVLETIGPDYVRDPERKEQLVLTAKEFPDERLTRVLLPYLDDDNEGIRFLAADTVASHGFDFVVEPLEERLREEDSVRICKHLAEKFAENEWKVSDPDSVREFLPDGYKIIRDGTVLKKK